MAVGTVAGINTQIVNANAPTARKQRVKVWWRAGHNGRGAHKLGVNQAEWEFQLIFFGTDAQCDAWAISIDALQATVVTIVDSIPDSYTKMLIVTITNKQKRPALHAGGLGLTGMRCEMTIAGVMT